MYDSVDRGTGVVYARCVDAFCRYIETIFKEYVIMYKNKKAVSVLTALSVSVGAVTITPPPPQ